jgi:alcohol dehydrogenase (cytochrome c)
MHFRARRLARNSLAAALCMAAFGARADDPTDWVTMNKDLSSQRYVDLDQITADNVDSLKPVCEFRMNEPTFFNSGVLRVGHTLYTSTGQATYSIDATTCKLNWRTLVELKQPPNNRQHRGIAYMDGMLFRGTPDGRMQALDAATGKIAWDVQNAIPAKAESFVAAPIAWNGKVFMGIATSDFGIRGRLMAFDAKTGQEDWRFYTIPMGDEPGADTWENRTEVTPGGGGFWSSFSLDPATGEFFGPVANPFPDYTPQVRPGANLYTNSVVSLNTTTGHLNWYYQAVPADQHDWDLGTAPTLYRTPTGKDMLAIAGKDGFVYGLDRVSHKPLFRTPGTTIANIGPVEETPKLVCPGTLGGAQWSGAAYNPNFGALYVGMVDWCWWYYKERNAPPTAELKLASNFPERSRGWITAMDGETGRVLWRFHADAPVTAGLVPTKSGLVIGGDVRGNLLFLDGRTGVLLHQINTKGAISNGLISYAVDGNQYVAAAVGGATLNTTAGVAGELRIVVYGLNAPGEPRIETVDRLPLPDRPNDAAVGGVLYFKVCVACHGPGGAGAAYVPLSRQRAVVTDAAALTKFLASVPPPMPRLYPGLLNQNEIRLISAYLKAHLAD